MIIRKKVWPRTVSDVLSMVFVLIISPLLYWFGLWIVLPGLYGDEYPVLYAFHFILGNFIMLNIIGNFTYTVLCDTSTSGSGRVIPVSTAKVADGWRLCTICECLAPPRSWHCSTCDTCILKRDHHCVFTGCCVGYYNHRYFVMFLCYLCFGAAYAFCYGSLFIWNRIPFEFPMSILKMLFPVIFFGFDMSMDQFYLMLYDVSAVGTLYTGILCIYHFNLILRGVVGNESNKKDFTYDMGWKDNIREVFGERWYLTWLLPYIKSQLPHDGVLWDHLSSKKD